MQTDLSRYKSEYSCGRPWFVQVLWFLLGQPLLRASLIPWSGLRLVLLRTFGAKVGQGVVIKPGVRVKYPWLLEIGDYCWIGEDAWIDNLERVAIESNVCLSQGVYICTGNHDWSDVSFKLIASPVTICEGAWIGAMAVVCPGVEVAQGAVASAGSVITTRMEAYGIYAGNPARWIKSRVLHASDINDPAREGCDLDRGKALIDPR